MARGAVLAVDLGEKRTGFAVADALRVSIEPLGPAREGEDGALGRIAVLAGERDREAIVVGLPLGPDGDETPRSRAVVAFCARLAERFPGVAIVTHDERYTTKEAEARLVASGRTGKARKEAKDSWSAAVLLEDWLESGEPGLR